MPKLILLNQIYASLTTVSGNRLDFFNVGGLAKQRTQKTLWGLWNNYSWRELFIRGGIIVATAVCGMLAANTAETNCSSITRGILGASVGFFSSHAVAVWPTIQRRNKIKKEIQAINKQINYNLDLLSWSLNGSPHFLLLQNVIGAINTISAHTLTLQLPLIKKGDAVRNLMKIRSLLISIDEQVKHFVDTLSQQKDLDQQLAFLTKAAKSWEQTIEDIQDKTNGTILEYKVSGKSSF